ncbi:MAG: MmcQ/YjbR family DNA-binding protein, partial [Frankiaceae bacterium]|nr:MmcQ/YjbR family DNA-binding protein [Frankiaceae bacterium]
MATWDDVRQTARDLPEAAEDPTGRTTAWRVGGKALAWERLLRRGEREQLGTAAPEGPALGMRTPDPDAVEALVAARPGVFFTAAGYGVPPMVL